MKGRRGQFIKGLKDMSALSADAVPDVEATCASLELPALPIAAGRARNFVSDFLHSWGEDEELIERAVMIVSELVTNAIRHGDHPLASKRRRRRWPGMVIVLAMTLQSDALYIEVRDDSPLLPVPHEPADGAESGRGMTIVDAVADSVVASLNFDRGKTVTAMLRRAPTIFFG
jgi:anti-sigma regulatory factor (Ser/Thr protein kinase)